MAPCKGEAIPGSQLGHAEVSPTARFEAGSYGSFTLTYTAGRFGIDDSGSLRICFRFASDQGTPQFDDRTGANYCTVTAANGAVLEQRWDPKGNVRPWDRTLWIKVVRGFLKEGDRIVVRFGVADHGGPGMRLQTFCEETFEFRVLIDPIATYNLQPVPVQPVISIMPGKPKRYVAVLPTLRRPDETFSLKIKGDDEWGNPSDQCAGRLFLEARGGIEALPQHIDLAAGTRAFVVSGLKASQNGKVSVLVRDRAGRIVAETNPLLIERRQTRYFWGDLHGQSEETIGTGCAREYFTFARDLAWGRCLRAPGQRLPDHGRVLG